MRNPEFPLLTESTSLEVSTPPIIAKSIAHTTLFHQNTWQQHGKKKGKREKGVTEI